MVDFIIILLALKRRIKIFNYALPQIIHEELKNIIYALNNPHFILTFHSLLLSLCQ